LAADDVDDIIAMTLFTGYSIHSQCMLGSLAQHCKLRSMSANQIGMKYTKLTANQLIADHIIVGDRKSMEKRNAVDL